MLRSFVSSSAVRMSSSLQDDVGVAALEVETLPDLFHRLVESVLDLRAVNLRDDVE